ncbi:MAG: Lrp/AsnC family transcriptional regulator [Thermoplasmatota archaeon]
MDDSMLIEVLLDDPTKSVRDIAREMNCTRQAIWRKKRNLEDENVIWGYTAVVDESKLNHIVFLVLMKMKPMDRKLAETLIHRVAGNEIRRSGIRLIDVFHVNGEFDILVRFSTSDHANARKYYDTLRLIYEDYLLDKPVMVDINFIMMAEGKRNPHLSKLLDFVPTVREPPPSRSLDNILKS